MLKITVSKKQDKINDKLKEKKKVASKPKVELKDGLTEKEFQEKKALHDTIRKIQGNDKITAKTHKLISDYIDKYGFSFIGIKQALEYFYIIQGNNFREDAVGIIPYTYDEAQNFYKMGEKTLEVNADVNLNIISNMYKKQTVKVSPKRLEIEQIDIGNIGQAESGCSQSQN